MLPLHPLLLLALAIPTLSTTVQTTLDVVLTYPSTPSVLTTILTSGPPHSHLTTSFNITKTIAHTTPTTDETPSVPHNPYLAPAIPPPILTWGESAVETSAETGTITWGGVTTSLVLITDTASGSLATFQLTFTQPTPKPTMFVTETKITNKTEIDYSVQTNTWTSVVTMTTAGVGRVGAVGGVVAGVVGAVGWVLGG